MPQLLSCRPRCSRCGILNRKKAKGKLEQKIVKRIGAR